jgi:hypothetical protein
MHGRRDVTKPDDVPAAEQGAESDEHRPDVDEGGTPGTVGALDGAAAIGSAGAVSADEREEDASRGVPDPNFGPD